MYTSEDACTTNEDCGLDEVEYQSHFNTVISKMGVPTDKSCFNATEVHYKIIPSENFLKNTLYLKLPSRFT